MVDFMNLTPEQKADLVVKKCYRKLLWAQKVNPNKDNLTMKDSKKIAVSKKLGDLLKKAERHQQNLKSKFPKKEPIKFKHKVMKSKHFINFNTWVDRIAVAVFLVWCVFNLMLFLLGTPSGIYRNKFKSGALFEKGV